MTGLEPAAFGATDRRSNQLSYIHQSNLQLLRPVFCDLWLTALCESSYPFSVESCKPIRTKRLTLVPVTVELVEADFAGPVQLGSFLDCEVPKSWPPEYFDDSARRWILVALGEGPHEFLTYYVLLRRREHSQPLLIGSGGFKGKPKDGIVEIGYGLVAEWQGKGLGTELVHGVLRFAFDNAEVSAVCAHTLEELIPSQRVLEKNGFTHRGVPLEEHTIRYEISRAEFNQRCRKKKSRAREGSNLQPAD
jgi:[ribosomal protein S5]-alanine N-acetyltransferase